MAEIIFSGMDPQPSIYPFGLRIDEPVTMVTDILVALVCWYAFFRLRPLADRPLHWRLLLFFILMGAATFLGGVLGHGFLYAFGFYAKLPGWLISMLAVNFVERAMIRYSSDVLSSRTTRVLTVLNWIELATFAALSFGTLNFLYVEIHSTYGFLVVVFSLAVMNYLRGRKTPFIYYTMLAVGMIFICSVVFVGKLAIHRWFSHADLAHIFMALGAYFFYRATRSLMLQQDESGATHEPSAA